MALSKKTGGPQTLSKGGGAQKTGDETAGGPDVVGNGQKASKDTVDISVADEEEWTGFYGLADMHADERYKNWRSLLTTEDLMVAAMMKRFMYEGEAVTNIAAYHGLRDAMGYLISSLKEAKNEKLAQDIDKAYSGKGDGSGGGDKMPPPPNP